MKIAIPCYEIKNKHIKKVNISLCTSRLVVETGYRIPRLRYLTGLEMGIFERFLSFATATADCYLLRDEEDSIREDHG